MTKPLKSLLAVAAAVGALGVTPVASAATGPELQAVPFLTTPGSVADTELDLTIPPTGAPIAKVTIFVAHGYTANLSQAVGTKIADVNAKISVGGTELPVTGQIVVDDPSKYVSDPRAQACAPGSHAAVWVIQATLGSTTVSIPMYVDPFSNEEIGTYQIQVCLASPEVPPSQGGAPAGARLTEADMDFPSTFTNPPTADICTWRAFLTPYVSGTTTPNPGGTVEVRSISFFPFTISVKARYDKKKHQAVLTGTVRAAGQPFPGVPVVILGGSTTNVSKMKAVGTVTTNKGGKFTFRKKISRTTFFSSFVPPGSGSCLEAPVTPAPCVDQTTAPGFGPVVRVKKR